MRNQQVRVESVQTRLRETPGGKRRMCKSVEVIWIHRVQGERSNQSGGSFSSQEAHVTFFSPEDKFKLSSHSLSCCFSHPADAVNNEQNTESGCQTGSQMDSVAIGEVSQSDDEWRTELTVLEMKCASLAAKCHRCHCIEKTKNNEADQWDFWRVAQTLPTQSKLNDVGHTVANVGPADGFTEALSAQGLWTQHRSCFGRHKDVMRMLVSVSQCQCKAAKKTFKVLAEIFCWPAMEHCKNTFSPANTWRWWLCPSRSLMWFPPVTSLYTTAAKLSHRRETPPTSAWSLQSKQLPCCMDDYSTVEHFNSLFHLFC